LKPLYRHRNKIKYENANNHEARNFLCWLTCTGFPRIFKNHFPCFFNTFSILNEKTVIPSLIFIFPKFYSWCTQRKKHLQNSPAVEKEIWINKRTNLEFPYFFNTLCTFWPNSILFQGLENWFHHSILFQYLVGTLRTVQKKRGCQATGKESFQMTAAKSVQRKRVLKGRHVQLIPANVKKALICGWKCAPGLFKAAIYPNAAYLGHVGAIKGSRGVARDDAHRRAVGLLRGRLQCDARVVRENACWRWRRYTRANMFRALDTVAATRTWAAVWAFAAHAALQELTGRERVAAMTFTSEFSPPSIGR